jgi:fatty-acid desaturase
MNLGMNVAVTEARSLLSSLNSKGPHMRIKNWTALLLIVVGGISVSQARAADPYSSKTHSKHHPKSGMMSEPTADMRKKMADMHQMMADCLKSEKPMKECKQEMMKNCPMMKDGKKCPMAAEMDMMGEHAKHE